jgi:hypothetical protein
MNQRRKLRKPMRLDSGLVFACEEFRAGDPAEQFCAARAADLKTARCATNWLRDLRGRPEVVTLCDLIEREPEGR